MHPEGVFEARDTRFAARTPRPRSSKCAGALAGEPGRRAVPRFGDRNAPHAHRLDVTDVVQREEAAIGGDDAGHATEDFLVMLDRGHEQLRIVVGHDRDVRDEASPRLPAP